MARLLGFHEKIQKVWKEEVDNPSITYEQTQKLEFDSRLGAALYAAGCIKFGEFRLRNGSTSPVYVDLRDAITDPLLRNKVTNIYIDLINHMETDRGEKFDVLGGIPQAATSYAAIIADRMERRLVQPRAGGRKQYGDKKSVEGVFVAGETVGLIDDLISNGGAKLDAIDQVEAAGLKVGGVAVLLDREQGGAESDEG